MTIKFNTPQRLANYNTQDIKDIFDKNDISVFLDSAFERKRIDQKEYSFLLNFLTTHDPKTLKAEDIHNLPNNNIYSIQKYFDEYNTSYIEAAYKQRLITEHEFKSLYKIYNDGMEYYSQVYDICLDLFGDPIYTTGFDMSTGKANKDEDGQTIDYTTKVLTPFVETRVKFQDRQGNALYIMFPKIKSAHRTIDKLTKEIGKSSRKNLHTAFERYLDSEDKELFDQICVSPLIKHNNKTIELHDITRLTITSKYLSGSKRLNNVLKKYEGAFGYTTDSPRNRFEMPLYENSKKYFDTKLIITLLDDNNLPYDVEIQLKIDTLYRADMRTHKNYEKYGE